MPSEPSQSIRIGILAGESSGDTLGAGLMRSVKARYPKAIFEGIGGPKMIAEGCHSFSDQERLAVMGYVEPLKRLPELLGIRKKIREHFLSNPPDVFIGIDSPSFNLPLERQFKEAGIKTVHYVSPQVWAWRQGRVKKIANSVDLMLTLFPFEAKFYNDHDVPVTFVGHTLADQLALDPDVSEARKALGLTNREQVIALLPGSRGSEVKLLAPEFLAAAQLCIQKNPQFKFLIPAANKKRLVQLETILADFPELPVTLMLGRSHEIMCAADAVMMASGTTTLEAMLLKKPMVVAYKFPALSYAILSRLIKTPHIALPNILAGKELVPEIIQDDVSPELLSEKIMSYFEDEKKVNELKNEFLTIHKTLKQDADKKAAAAVLNLIKTV
ncbi:MAG: lipid-A-disaccharide synthase [Cellvibrionaceae bacterium]